MARPGWDGVWSQRGGEGAGGVGRHALNAILVWVVARKRGPSGVRGGGGHALVSP